MALLQGFLTYFLQFIAYAAIAFCGVLLGIKLRKNKDAKTKPGNGEE